MVGCGLRDWTGGPTEAQKVEHLGTHVGTVGYHIRAYTEGREEKRNTSCFGRRGSMYKEDQLGFT
jgi:hypothetical protein